MRLQAHQAVGEGVEALVDQQLHTQEFARRFAHLAAAFDQEIIVHPKSGAAVDTAAARLILRDFIGVVDFAMVDAAGVDVKRQAEQRL
jgi:rhodanese-related sulfurtransferase